MADLPADPARPRPAGRRAAALLVGVFVLGLVCGAAGMFAADRWDGGGRGHRRTSSIDRLTRELGLDPAQRQEVERILETKREKLRPIQDESRREIRAVLRPEQQERFDAMARRRERDRGGPGDR